MFVLNWCDVGLTGVMFVLNRYDAATDTLSMSYTQYKTDSINFLGRLAVWLFSTFKLVDVRQVEKEDGQYTECSNMTIINLVLRWFGPLPERTVTVYLVVFQVKHLNS